MKNRFTLSILAAVLFLGACEKKNPRVAIETPKGTIVIELYTDKAPETAGRFLELAKRGLYSGGNFYRVVRGDNDTNPAVIQVLQGGVGDNQLPDDLGPIPHENTDQTGIKHLHGVVSMARREPGTARSEFFICINDQKDLDMRGLRNPDGQGFAAFGKVVEGMDVVKAIWRSPVQGQRLSPPVLMHEVKVVR